MKCMQEQTHAGDSMLWRNTTSAVWILGALREEESLSVEDMMPALA